MARRVHGVGGAGRGRGGGIAVVELARAAAVPSPGAVAAAPAAMVFSRHGGRRCRFVKLRRVHPKWRLLELGGRRGGDGRIGVRRGSCYWVPCQGGAIQRGWADIVGRELAGSICAGWSKGVGEALLGTMVVKTLRGRWLADREGSAGWAEMAVVLILPVPRPGPNLEGAVGRGRELGRVQRRGRQGGERMRGSKWPAPVGTMCCPARDGGWGRRDLMRREAAFVSRTQWTERTGGDFVWLHSASLREWLFKSRWV